MTGPFDAIVVGLGAMGSATLLQLARRGARVLGIDRFRPPHAEGSSHGETRITRRAIGENADYAAFALRSHAIWRELEAWSGERLLLECGFLAIDSSGDTAEMHGKPGFFATTLRAAERFQIPHAVLTAAEARRAFPRFRVPDEARVFHEPGGGLVFPEACIRVQLAAAEAAGARILTDAPVLDIAADAHGVTVTTAHGRHTAADAVVAAGGWSPGLVGGPVAGLPIHRQVLHWFDADDLDAFAADRSPTFIWTHGPSAANSFYGFPYVPGLTRGVKVAEEQYDVAAPTPEAVDRRIDPAEAAAMHHRHVSGRLAGVSARALKGVTCFYTMAPRGDFIIGRVPGRERILAVSACSGHGFKHSAGVGDHVAGLLTAT